MAFGHKEHHHRSMGGKLGAGESPKAGKKEWEEDAKDKPEDRSNTKKIAGEAEERKHGGRAKRKAGGMVHHERGEHMKHAKHVGEVKGEHGKHHVGRKPRKSGGRTGSNFSPLSSAFKGVSPKAHNDMEKNDED